MTDPTDRSENAAGRADLLDPAVLSRLGGIELVARRVVEGFLMGLHRSPRRGFSAEFAEHRAYQPGDDLRYVDWRMYGRSDRFYVKQFEEETTLTAWLLLDASASMAWSSRPDVLPTKLWYARLLSACLGRILLRQGDSLGLVAFDEAPLLRLPPRTGERQWRELVRRLEGVEAGTRTNAHATLRGVARRMGRRGLVILVSDLLVDPDPTVEAVRFLRHRGHEVLVFHLLDPGERELPATGDARFYDPETGDELPVAVGDLRGEYRRAVRDALGEWRRLLAGAGADHEVIGTERPPALALRAYARRRPAG